MMFRCHNHLDLVCKFLCYPCNHHMPASPHPHILATTLRSLQRVDPGITKTLAQAGYVVAYREVAEGEWEKMGVEGGLFVYQR